ncbi:dipeptidyl aminopeptidase/acylaminoacyl peptidase [Granulicella aggregans]|uniref:Dipeptidyl aminopeptidase/acylaminoacyl peptidase n=1 Tax=Granulicella aggregans TaxID=474949 RepID=A0A7W7ZEE9_9BACT|nr:S9 family peptidase [Granulicella aggregans]MBB5058389.1 dipeptidyl aminopeptidase/acylaminoacyl peptidase [Granulicella aggregans]
MRNLSLSVLLRPVLRFGTSALLVSLALPFAAAAQTAKHNMTPDDLAKFVRVGSPVLSPDGKLIAYTVSRINTEEDKRTNELWMIGFDGQNDVQLTYGKESAGNPQWSPDGRYLSFTSSREGKAKGSQVWLLDRRGGEARQLTEVKENLGGYSWSPDSKTLLLGLQVKDEPEPEKGGKPVPPKPIVLDRFHFKQDVEGYLTEKKDHLYLFDVESKKLSKLIGTQPDKDHPLDEKYEESQAVWSPDGSKIAFVSNQSVPDPDRTVNSDVFVVDAKAGSNARKLTTFIGADEGPLSWSPDGAMIAYRKGTSEKYSIYEMPQLATVEVATGNAELVAKSLDNWTSGPVFSVDGKSILTTIQDDRLDYPAEVSLSGAVKRLVRESGSASGLTQKAGHVALLWTTDSTDPEIYSLEGGTLHKLTSHNDEVVASLNLATTEELSAKTSDGNDVHSLLTMPVGYKAGTKVPMLLFIHGGPTGQDAHEFDPYRQIFAGHGYAVLNVNYRGSTGRGHAYSYAINADWGHKEVIDLMASVDAAIATGRIDADKLVVGGWSYGGILTDYSIASTTRFKAASSGAGMGNLIVLYGIDEYIQQYENEIGPPWKNTELYLKLSYPFFHADRIKTPTLFMGGDKDFNVPLEGGEQMYQALKSVGTPAELIVYPGEFHGFQRPSFVKDRFVRWMGWYDKYLGIAPAPATPVVPSK